MNKNISKYIDSNREINSNLYELNPYKKILTKKTYGTNVTLVEDDIFYRKDKTQKNEIQNDQNYHELNLNESLSDDDIQVIHQFNEEEDQQSSNKRKRLDSDEEVDDKTSVKDELDELIKDEDGDIMIDQAKVIFELNQNKKTVYRDEKGNRVERSNLKKEKRKELEQKNNENLAKWAKGIKQLEEKNLKLEELQRAKEEPLVRYEIDTRTDKELKEKKRFGDPMKKFIRGIANEENFSRGFYLPNCKFPAPSNRFNIQPGYRWDGVDRGIGFERRYLESINIRKAKQEEHYKLRTEDM